MPHNFENIPHEMRAYRQWVCWRLEGRGGDKATKIPYCPSTGGKADVTRPDTWATYEEAVAAAPQYSGIGFVLTKDDPYAFIDLDDTNGDAANFERQVKIFNEFASYTERSPSGNGLHIILRGRVPNGRRRSAVEVYSDARYMTMTGNVFAAKPIVARDEMLELLWTQMGKGQATAVYDGSVPATMSDADLIARASGAVNGAKFDMLMDGDWKHDYSSQSQADLALINMLAFYSQNTAQIKRIFMSSALAAREKAARVKYVDSLIMRAYDRMLPPIDFDRVRNDVADHKRAVVEAAPPAPIVPPAPVTTVPTPTSGLPEYQPLGKLPPPPGLLGELSRFIYSASVRPVPETALVAALGLMAGITGRSFNYSGTGLNMYILFLAQTGTGKEGIASGINKLMSAVQHVCPAVNDFRGPAEIASGQALLKQIAQPTKSCFVSVVGEFGLKMQQLASPRASSAELMLKRVLLDLYNKSGAKDLVAPSVYADSDKSTQAVKSPSVTIIGESTPETFYSCLNERMIADGLLPRFMFIEYTGSRPSRNKNHMLAVPSEQLVNQLAELTTFCLHLGKMERHTDVQCTAEAEEFLDGIDELLDGVMRKTNTDVLQHLWNRGHVKMLKLAALVAVGVNYVEPCITLDHAKWAYNVVMSDIMSIVTRFTRGDVGEANDENKQGLVVLKACLSYIEQDTAEVQRYGVDGALHEAGIITHSFLARRLGCSSLFKNDKLGATNALKRAVQGLIDAGDIQEVNKADLMRNYAFSGRAYIMSDIPRVRTILANTKL